MIKDRVCQHLRSVGYDQTESSRFASLIQKWCDRSGNEWTVERLKSLKVAFKNSLETGQYQLPAYWATRKNRSGKTIVRDGFVHRVLTSPNEGKNLVRKEAFLRLYQVIKLDGPSKKQLSKMETAIEGKPTADPEVLRQLCSAVKVRRANHRTVARVQVVGNSSKTLSQMWGNRQKRSPAYVIPENDSGKSTKLVSTSREDVETAKFIDYFSVDRQTNEFWSRYPGFVGDRLLGPGRPCPRVRYTEIPLKDLPAGTLTVIQEGGAKARWVANPLLAFQALGEPLKDKLWEYTKELYPDVICTDDQGRGYGIVAQWITEGRKVWSFDASSFTDRFPLQLQLSVLQQLQDMGIASKADVESFKLVVQKRWQCNVVGREISWTQGQPLGYGPSFHIATLTHAALVETLAKDPSVLADAKMFCVVGDDIVIADERLAHAYEFAMTKLGVEINRQKSLISNDYAEFLGKLISKEGVNPSIKVKFLLSSDQVVDTLRFYGPNGLKWLTPRERGMAMRAYLPVDLGGLDWRLPNTTYREWLAITRQEEFAVKRLVNDVAAFYGRESLTGASDVEREINRRIEFYSINGYDLSASEWARLGVTEELNALTNLPIAKTREESRSLPSTSNTFVHVVDMVSKLSSRGLETTPLTKDYLDSLLRNNHVAITRHGYLNETEKPYTGQSVIEVTNEQSSPAVRVKERDVFHKGRKRHEEDPGYEP
uniref:RNA-dependent RNA polymerase n=1 Tax=Zhangye Narna tick virus 1 TaxID=2972236 RepID=A0A9E7V1X7_9VIRU|nr:MAG: RNA-dependent RNA polymerase [Zhangye Narna tick virus 1]